MRFTQRLSEFLYPPDSSQMSATPVTDEPVDLFTGPLERVFSPHYRNEHGDYLRHETQDYPNIPSWHTLVMSGEAAAFVAGRRTHPDWTRPGTTEVIGHPYIQFYIYKDEGVKTCGLSRFHPNYPDDGHSLSGKIVVDRGDAFLLEDGSLIMQGEVSIYCALRFAHREHRVFNTVAITRSGGIVFP